MVPPTSDPRWLYFAANLTSFPVKGLATCMLLSRLHIKTIFEGEAESRLEVIDSAYAFFRKNQEMLADDIKLIFERAEA